MKVMWLLWVLSSYDPGWVVVGMMDTYIECMSRMAVYGFADSYGPGARYKCLKRGEGSPK